MDPQRKGWVRVVEEGGESINSSGTRSSSRSTTSTSTSTSTSSGARTPPQSLRVAQLLCQQVVSLWETGGEGGIEIVYPCIEGLLTLYCFPPCPKCISQVPVHQGLFFAQRPPFLRWPYAASWSWHWIAWRTTFGPCLRCRYATRGWWRAFVPWAPRPYHSYGGRNCWWPFDFYRDGLHAAGAIGSDYANRLVGYPKTVMSGLDTP